MTTLRVNWQNCCRTPAERIKVERKYHDRLLELCNSVAFAKSLHDLHNAQHRPPTSTWARFNAVAMIEATTTLTPTERRDARFTVRFEHD